MPTAKANTVPVGTIAHKNWLRGFLAAKTGKKKRKHNGLHNSPIERKKIYYFLQEVTFLSWY